MESRQKLASLNNFFLKVDLGDEQICTFSLRAKLVSLFSAHKGGPSNYMLVVEKQLKNVTDSQSEVCVIASCCCLRVVGLLQLQFIECVVCI